MIILEDEGNYQMRGTTETITNKKLWSNLQQFWHSDKRVVSSHKTTSALGHNWNRDMTEEISQRKKKNKQLCSTAVIPIYLIILACAALLGVFPPKADTRVHVSKLDPVRHSLYCPPNHSHTKATLYPTMQVSLSFQPGIALVPWPLTDQDNWSILVCKRERFGGEFRIAFMPKCFSVPWINFFDSWFGWLFTTNKWNDS